MVSSVQSAVWHHFENAFFQNRFGVYSAGEFATEMGGALKDPRFREPWEIQQSLFAPAASGRGLCQIGMLSARAIVAPAGLGARR
jgi:hypothetical protein